MDRPKTPLRGRAPALRVTRLALTNWRNFRTAEVTLGGRAFIVGPNASGKSNLLDALRFLRDLARPGGGLTAAFSTAHRGSFSAVRCLEARNPAHLGIEVDVGTDEAPAAWSYALHLQQRRGERMPTVLLERVVEGGAKIAEKARASADPPDLFVQTMVEQSEARQPFVDLVRFFASIRYLHVVPQIVRDPRRHLSDHDDPYGGDLLRRIKQMPKKSREPRLRKLGEALKIAVPQFERLWLDDDVDGQPHLFAAYRHWRPRASPQSEEVFSDGALRLIGLLWSITEGGGPLLLEEPELSLHEAVVGQIPSMIARARRLSGRQVIATTHSQAMLDAPGIAPDEVHRVAVGRNGSTIETASQNPEVRAQVEEGGWTLGQAVLPFTQPDRIEELGRLDVALD
jgi:predicted ATPase